MTDNQQTAHIAALLVRLRSIAIQAVQAQDGPGTDAAADLLDDIERDLRRAQKLNDAIARDVPLKGL